MQILMFMIFSIGFENVSRNNPWGVLYVDYFFKHRML